ncbi:MAG: sensor hybrid histidine kinase [Micavibrio sp.]|nr:sensor hybrid histidine kinase [Micavibrio sp.]
MDIQEAMEMSAAPAIRKNVLLVEDYQPNALVVSTMLDIFGYDCEIVTNGAEALRQFPEGNYDLVLMDVQMPIMDGLSATRMIRNLERERDLSPTPIIAMTAQASLDFRMKCAEAGMNGFIPKPFSHQHLAALLEDFMSMKGENNRDDIPKMPTEN